MQMGKDMDKTDSILIQVPAVVVKEKEQREDLMVVMVKTTMLENYMEMFMSLHYLEAQVAVINTIQPKQQGVQEVVQLF